MISSASSLVTDPAVTAALHPIEGAWRNQLGSKLTLKVDRRGGLQGTYYAGAGSSGPHLVTGSYDPSPSQPGTVLGFVVDWTEAHSVTVWSGQYHSGDDVIRATWLMSTETDPADDWRSTFVGYDVFQRESI
jgi:hypothetical protein